MMGAACVTYTVWLRHRGCDRKRRHASELDANLTVLRIWSAGRWAWRYSCLWCAGWHITSEGAPDA